MIDIIANRVGFGQRRRTKLGLSDQGIKIFIKVEFFFLKSSIGLDNGILNVPGKIMVGRFKKGKEMKANKNN